MIGAAAVFFVLLWQVETSGVLTQADDAVHAWVRAHVGAGLVRLCEVIALLGEPVVVGTGLAMGLALLGLGRQCRAMAAFLVAVVGAGLTMLIVKELVDRQRPEADFGVAASGSSFPSASTVLATALFGAFAIIVLPRLMRARTIGARASALMLLPPVAVAVSRVLVSAHFTTDVLAGLCLGAFWLLAASLVAPAQVAAGSRP